MLGLQNFRVRLAPERVVKLVGGSCDSERQAVLESESSNHSSTPLGPWRLARHSTSASRSALPESEVKDEQEGEREREEGKCDELEAQQGEEDEDDYDEDDEEEEQED
jgi:hypothetical protein